MDKWPGGQNIEKRKKMKTVWDLWGNIKCTNICILRVPEREEREKGSKKIFEEIIAEKFPNMGKEIISQVQEFHTEKSPVSSLIRAY